MDSKDKKLAMAEIEKLLEGRSNANVAAKSADTMNPQQVKIAAMEDVLAKTKELMGQHSDWLKYLKKKDKKLHADYEEELEPYRRSSMSKKPQSPSKYNDNSPSQHRGSVISRRETFKGY